MAKLLINPKEHDANQIQADNSSKRARRARLGRGDAAILQYLEQQAGVNEPGEAEDGRAVPNQPPIASHTAFNSRDVTRAPLDANSTHRRTSGPRVINLDRTYEAPVPDLPDLSPLYSPPGLLYPELEGRALSQFAGRLFKATHAIDSQLHRAEAMPNQQNRHLRQAIHEATEIMDRIAETGDLDKALAALRPESIPSLRHEMDELGIDAFLQAEEQILLQVNVPEDVRKKALDACREVWETVGDKQSLDARRLMDGMRKLRDRTNQLAESLGSEPPEQETGGGIMQFLGQCLEVGLGMMLLTVNLSALGVLAQPLTLLAHFLGTELFKEAMGPEPAPVARIAGYLAEVIIDQAVQAE